MNISDPGVYALSGMVMLNHWQPLASNWKKESEEDLEVEQENANESREEPIDRVKDQCVKHPSAYAAGVLGHAISSFEKIVAIIALFFVDVALTAHYFKPQLIREEVSEGELAKREMRLILGWIALADSVPSLFVDAFVGVFCPPAAYRIHDLIIEKCYLPLFVALEITDELELEEFKVRFSPWNLFYLAYSEFQKTLPNEASSA